MPGLALQYTEYEVQKLNLNTFARYAMFWTNIEWLKIIHSWSSDRCERLLEVLKIERTLRGNEDLPTFLNLTFEEVRIHGTALKYEGNLRRSFSETAITNVCCCFLDCMSTRKCTMYSLRVINSSVKLLRVPLFNLPHRYSYFGSFKKIKQVLKQLSSFSGVSKEYYRNTFNIQHFHITIHLCYQAAEDRWIMALAVIQSASGTSTGHIARSPNSVFKTL